MPEVVSFVDYQPPQRFDSVPWTHVRVEESATEDGVFVLIDTILLSPVDSDPADPLFRSFTTENGTAADYWYQIVFSDTDGDLSVPTEPVQNSAGAVSYPTSYVAIEELQRVLGKSSPTAAETAAMNRVLEAAAQEIDWDLGYTSLSPAPVPTPPIIVDVNLDRASELWRFNFSTSGILPQGPDIGVIVTPRDTWNRHHLRLNPLRLHVGIA